MVIFCFFFLGPVSCLRASWAKLVFVPIPSFYFCHVLIVSRRLFFLGKNLWEFQLAITFFFKAVDSSMIFMV